MAEIVVGVSALQRRLHALSGAGVMKALAAATSGQLRKNSPGQKTRIVANSWQVASVTETHATVTGSIINLWLDEGTGLYGPLHHLITPNAKKALAFHSQGKGIGLGANYRLSGRMTAASARKHGANADLVVVRSVKGMKARPFIKRSIQAVGGEAGVQSVYKAWNDAA